MKKETFFSYSIVGLFILVSMTFIYMSNKNHEEQLNSLKIVYTEKAKAQFFNLSSLFNLETSLSDNLSLNHGKSMLAFKLIEERNKELSYNFKMTSLKPLNSKNTPDLFERRGLERFENNKNLDQYVEFNKNELQYIGKLLVQKSCLKCHGHQGYKEGDIRGGLRVTVPLSDYNKDVMSIKNEYILELLLIMSYFMLILFSIYIYIQQSKKNNKKINDLNHSLEEKIKERTQQLENNHAQVITSFIKLIEQRDPYTAGHSDRVAKYSVAIAQKMKFDDEKINVLYQAAILHDVGKISIPDNLLLKPDKLTKAEYKLIQDHSTLGYIILDSIDEYKTISKIVKWHHERFDGSGYPDGLKGEDIPIESQIIALADTFDAMTTNRIYKPRKTIKEAIHEIRGLTDDFNPIVLKAGLKALRSMSLESTTQLPTTETEEMRFAYFFKDPLTEVYNERYVYNKINIEHDKYSSYLFTVIITKNFTKYNEKYTWNHGNKLLIKIANILKEKYKNSIIARFEGDDFIILSKDDKIDNDTLLSILPKSDIIEYEIFNHDVSKEIEVIKQMLE